MAGSGQKRFTTDLVWQFEQAIEKINKQETAVVGIGKNHDRGRSCDTRQHVTVSILLKMSTYVRKHGSYRIKLHVEQGLCVA